MITDWTSMFPPDSDEYWPELQEAINYWEKRTADDSGMFNQLVFSLMQAEHRTEAAKAALAAVPDYIAYYLAATNEGDAAHDFGNWYQGAAEAEEWAKAPAIDFGPEGQP